MIRVTRRRLALALLAAFFVLFLYLGSYVLLSYRGRYMLTQSGEMRSSLTHLSVSDMWEWQPLLVRHHCYRDITGAMQTRASFLGRICCPLIFLDRKYIHRTERLMDELVEGGVYLVDSFGGTYEAAKILRLKNDAVMYWMYDNVFDDVPNEVSPDELTRAEDAAGAIMPEDMFKQAHPRFLFQADIAAAEHAFIKEYETLMTPEGKVWGIMGAPNL